MAIPDFNFKPDATIIQAFQNAQQQKLQAEQLELQKQQQSFNQVKETATAIGGLVSSFVQAAEQRKTKNMINEAKIVLAQPEPAATITPAGPTLEGQTMAPVANPEVAKRKQALANITGALAPEKFGEMAAKALLPDKSRGLISGRDIQQFWIVSPDGKERKSVRYDEVTDTMSDIASGDPIDRSEINGWQMVRATPTVKQDAAGNFITIEPTTGTESGRVASGAQAIPKEKYGTVTSLNDPLVPTEDRKQILARISTIENDETIKNAKKLVPTMDNVIRFLDSNNKIAMDRLGGLVQKMVAMDSGALAQWEQRDPNSREYIERIKQFYTMGVKGELTPEAKEELKELLVLSGKSLAENVKEATGVTLNSLEAAYPQLNRQYLDDLAGLKDFNRYISKWEKIEPKQSKPSTTSTVIKTIDDARKMPPEQRKARIKQILDEQGNK